MRSPPQNSATNQPVPKGEPAKAVLSPPKSGINKLPAGQGLAPPPAGTSGAAPMTSTILFAEIRPTPEGGYIIKPRKPVREIGTKEALGILNVSRASFWYLLNSPTGQKTLRWRWLSERQGKRLFELDSVLEYLAATRDPEFGEDRNSRRERLSRSALAAGGDSARSRGSRLSSGRGPEPHSPAQKRKIVEGKDYGH